MQNGRKISWKLTSFTQTVSLPNEGKYFGQLTSFAGLFFYIFCHHILYKFVIMLPQKDILSLIKERVLTVTPDAKVLLFGSRATGNTHAESDWDILILTQKKYPKSAKWLIHDKIFPISISNATFFNILLVQEHEWNFNAAYYALKMSIGKNLVAA